MAIASLPPGPGHPAGLGEGRRAVDEVDDERHRRPVEPRVAKRQRFGSSLTHADTARDALPCDAKHLDAGIDAPNLRAGLVGERRRELSRAAADVEDASASEVAELDECMEPGPPRVVLGAQRVVVSRAGVEVRRALGSHVDR